MEHLDRSDRSPAIAELLEDAYAAPVGVEAAARHLWAIHKTAEAMGSQRDGGAHDSGGHDGGGVGRVAELVPSRSGRVPRAAVPLLVVMMMLSSSGMALAASQRSLPGDVLYAVKRGSESAQLVFARSPEARAQLQLAFAQTRLEEIRRIGATRPQHVASLVSDIAMSLSEVELAGPEVAVDSQRLRQETSDEIAALQLPGEVVVATDQALAAAPTEEVVGTSTATSPTQPAANATTEDQTTSSLEETSTETEVPLLGGAAATLEPSESASPTPTSTSSPSPSGTPSSEPASSPSDVAGSPSSDGGDPATAEAGGGEPAGEGSTGSQGTLVTPRPQPSGEGGESRADDGSDGTDADGSTGGAPPSEGETTEPPPVDPYSRSD